MDLKEYIGKKVVVIEDYDDIGEKSEGVVIGKPYVWCDDLTVSFYLSKVNYDEFEYDNPEEILWKNDEGDYCYNIPINYLKVIDNDVDNPIKSCVKSINLNYNTNNLSLLRYSIKNVKYDIKLRRNKKIKLLLFNY